MKKPHYPQPLAHGTRAFCGTTFRKYCDVCGVVSGVIMIEGRDEREGTITLSISCHGSKETKVFSEATVTIDDYDNLYGPVLDWLIHAFKDEMNPDVRLVLNYNQGRAMPEKGHVQ